MLAQAVMKKTVMKKAVMTSSKNKERKLIPMVMMSRVLKLLSMKVMILMTAIKMMKLL